MAEPMGEINDRVKKLGAMAPPKHPGPRPAWTVDADPGDREAFRKALDERNARHAAWEEAYREWHERLDEPPQLPANVRFVACGGDGPWIALLAVLIAGIIAGLLCL